MERLHLQVAPPQPSDDIDLPLLDLSISDESTPAAATQPSAASQAPPATPLEAAAADTIQDRHRAAKEGEARHMLQAVDPQVEKMRKPVGATILSTSNSSAPACPPSPSSDSDSSSSDDAFCTRIPVSSFVDSVLSDPSTFLDRAQLEVEMLHSLASAPQQRAKLYMESTRDAEMSRKNRYSNIIPTKKARVLLPTNSDNPADAYINACLLPPLLKGCAQPYIACQAPLPHTAADFWSMVWHQRCSIIVMLTKEQEKDSRGHIIHKAHPYWPEPHTHAAATKGSSSAGFIRAKTKRATATSDVDYATAQAQLAKAAVAAAATASEGGASISQSQHSVAQFGPFTVRLLSTHSEPDILIRQFSLTRTDSPVESSSSSSSAAATDSSRIVHHVQYTGWPDFGVPDEQEEEGGFMRVFKLYRDIRDKVHKEEEEKRRNDTVAAPPTAATPATANSSAAASSSTYAPIVVHCSAGIGRSGVWIAIDALLDYLAARGSSSSSSPSSSSVSKRRRVSAAIDVFRLVKKMRESRQGMVQTPQQYAFISLFIATCLQNNKFGVSLGEE